MASTFDIAIIGGGPAGFSAAITARVRNKKTILIDGGGFSSRLQKSKIINNYPGLPGISGKALMQKFYEQTKQLGAEFLEKKVQSIFPGNPHIIMVGDEIIEAKVIIICTGVGLTNNIQGEEKLLGSGVSYCATCDGMFFKDKTVAVYINNLQELDEVNFLSEITSQLYIIGSQNIITQIQEKFETKNIDRQKTTIWLANKTISRINGESKVESITIDQSDIPVEGVFLLRETTPLNQLIEGLTISQGKIVVNQAFNTNYPGIFAAGDVIGEIRQISKAVGDGAQAVISAITYLDNASK